jgi:hypothetical protein
MRKRLPMRNYPFRGFTATLKVAEIAVRQKAFSIETDNGVD